MAAGPFTPPTLAEIQEMYARVHNEPMTDELLTEIAELYNRGADKPPFSPKNNAWLRGRRQAQVMVRTPQELTPERNARRRAEMIRILRLGFDVYGAVPPDIKRKELNEITRGSILTNLPEDVEGHIASYISGEKGSIKAQNDKLKQKLGYSMAPRAGRRTRRRHRRRSTRRK